MEVDGHVRGERRGGGVDRHVVHHLHAGEVEELRDEEHEAEAGARDGYCGVVRWCGGEGRARGGQGADGWVDGWELCSDAPMPPTAVRTWTVSAPLALKSSRLNRSMLSCFACCCQQHGRRRRRRQTSMGRSKGSASLCVELLGVVRVEKGGRETDALGGGRSNGRLEAHTAAACV